MKIKIKNDINIFCEGGIKLPYKSLSKKNIKDIIADTMKHLELNGFTVNYIVTDNTYIQEINNQYRNKNYPTDVISFTEEDDFPGMEDSGCKFLGDVYLSLEKALEQSTEYKVTFPDEVKRLVVHSILHLIGYDHEISKFEEKRMFQMEDKILSLMKNGEVNG